MDNYQLVLVVLFVFYLIYMNSNRLKGIFIHKHGDKNHFPVERYSGITCIGYKCHGCGYQWYEKRSTGEKFN